MNEESPRPRMRLDLAPDIIRAVRARAGEDGVGTNEVIAAALELYLSEELARIRSKMKSEKGRKAKE